MNPETVRAWQRIARDTVIVIAGVFMLIYETVAADNPNAAIIGAALACFALPPALRYRGLGHDKDDH